MGQTVSSVVVMSVIRILVSIIVIVLTSLVSLIIGSEKMGWDGAAWHGSGQTTKA